MSRLLRAVRRRRAAALAAAVLLAAGAARGQEADEGVIYGARPRGRAVHIDPVRGALIFQSQYTRDSTQVEGGAEVEDTVLTFRELLELSTRGYFVHPNLAEFNLSGSVGFEQDQIETSAGRDSVDSAIYQWDASITFLRNQPLSGTLYTQRVETLVNQPFGETFRSTDTTYGGVLQYRSEVLPTTVRAYRTETVQSSLDGDQDFTIDQNVFEWHTDWRISDRQSLSFNYNYIGTDQSSQTEVDQFSTTTDTQSASLSHSIAFGKDRGSSLSSTIVATDTTGILPRQSFRWDELLQLRHGPTFRTDYSYSLDQQSTPDVDQTVQTATAGFTHRLYESLTSRGLLRYTELDLSGEAQTETILARLDLDYRKRVPYGTLLADLGLSYGLETSQARREELQVLNQPIRFVNFQPVVLQRPDIIIDSIALHNAAGFFFSPVSDYQVFDRDAFVEIFRRPGSVFIREGDTVLLDYRLAPEPESESETQTFNIGARYDIQEGPLTGWSPYVAYFYQDQTFEAGGPTALRADQVQDVRVGVDYLRGDWLLKAEYQVHDSTIFPFDAIKLRARWNHRFGVDTLVALEGNYTLTTYSEPTNENTTVSVSASVSRQLSRQLLLTATADWLSVEDELGGSTEGFQQQIELTWRHRQLEVFARLRNSTLDSTFQEESFQLFMIGIRREF